MSLSRYLSPALLIVLALLVAGCGKSEGDLVPPTLSVTLPTTFPLDTSFGPNQYPGPYTFGGTVEAGGTVQVAVNTTATIANLTVSGTSWSAELVTPAEGNNTVTVTANDQRGNLNIVSFGVLYDSVAPSVGYDQFMTPTPSDNQIIGGSVEAGATVTVNGNPATVIDGFWSYALSGLTTGTNNLTISALDPAGNGSAPLTPVLVVDPAAPALTIAPVATTVASTVTLSGTAPATGYSLTVTPASSSVTAAAVVMAAGSWTCDLANLAGGNNVVAVTLRDTADQVVATGSTVVRRDIVAPTITTVTPSSASTLTAVPVQIEAVFSEQLDPATVTTNAFTLTDSSNNPVTATVSYLPAQKMAVLVPTAPLTDGQYTATLATTLTDTVGNPLSAGYAWSFTINIP